jgi:L-methionine (R)-S-oxide reductase
MALILIENSKKQMKNSELRDKITNIVNNTQSVDMKLQNICDLLRNSVSHYDWVGFYFKNGARPELKLAQYSGKPTEHTIIPFGKGICGQVALSNANFVAQDVNEQDNYISCGFNVKSEIVVPIFKNDVNIGQIDIDSHEKSPFTKNDEELLEFTCQLVATLAFEIS